VAIRPAGSVRSRYATKHGRPRQPTSSSGGDPAGLTSEMLHRKGLKSGRGGQGDVRRHVRGSQAICDEEHERVGKPSAASTSSARSATTHAAIDNQLRGRSGRQGDPGSSRFYLSLE